MWIEPLSAAPPADYDPADKAKWLKGFALALERTSYGRWLNEERNGTYYQDLLKAAEAAWPMYWRWQPEAAAAQEGEVPDDMTPEPDHVPIKLSWMRGTTLISPTHAAKLKTAKKKPVWK